MCPGAQGAQQLLAEGTRLCVTLTKNECYLRNKPQVKIILAKVPALALPCALTRRPAGHGGSPAISPPCPGTGDAVHRGTADTVLTRWALFRVLSVHFAPGKQAHAKVQGLLLCLGVQHQGDSKNSSIPVRATGGLNR